MRNRIVQLVWPLVALLTRQHDYTRNDATLTRKPQNQPTRAPATSAIPNASSRITDSTVSWAHGWEGRATGQPAEEQRSAVMKSWPPSPLSVGRSRRFLAHHLDAWELSHLTDVAELIISELVTNAVTHAYPPYGHVIATRLERIDGGVRIEVHDANDRKPEPREAAPDAESGRGLALVDALTLGNWGVSDRKGPGKMVWAECVAEAGRDARPPRD